MIETLQDIEDIVGFINADLYDKMADDGLEFLVSVCSCSYVRYIKFLGAQIWNSEDDYREWDESTQDYEPLEPYLRKEINKTLANLKGLVL
tara:strand:- start:337 stop:609 length:273 start_codon:yes stop_codon:yes gene_type:complete